MQKTIIFTIFLNLYCVLIFSQTKSLSGYIFFLNEQNLDGIYITNLKTKKTVLTNQFGYFIIDVSIDDVLKIQHSSIKEKQFLIDKSEFNQDKLRIFVEPYYVPLSEVVVKKPLTGIFSLDVKQHNKTPKLDIEQTIGIPNFKGKNREISKPVFQSIVPIPDPFALYDILSGERKKRENLFKFIDKNEAIEQIRNYLGDKFFTNDLKIPEEHIDLFIEYVYEITPLQSYLKNRNYISIITELDNKHYIYLARLKTSKYWKSDN